MTEVVFIFAFAYLISSIGIFCSILSLVIIFRQSSLHNAFGLLCGIQCIFNGFSLFLATFLLMTAILINPSYSEGALLNIVGFMSLFLHYSVVFLQVLKSINRFCAISFPTHYHLLFSNKKATGLIFVVLIFTLIFTIITHNLMCLFKLSTTSFVLAFKEKECNEITSLILSITAYLTLFLLIISISCDFVTLCCLRRFRRKFTNQIQRRREMTFVLQTIITTFLWGGLIAGPRIFRAYTTTDFMTFLVAKGITLLYYASNEVIFVLIFIKIKKTSTVTPALTAAPREQNDNFVSSTKQNDTSMKQINIK